MQRLAWILTVAAIAGVNGCAGHASRSPVDVSADFRAHAAGESITVYPVELVKPDRVYHDPHEAARFGEALRQNGFGSLRLSPQHADLKAAPSMNTTELLRSARQAIASHLRENPPETRYGLLAAYVLDGAERPIAVLVAGGNTAGEPAVAIVLDSADARFAKNPPRNLLECAELLGKVLAEEAGITRQR